MSVTAKYLIKSTDSWVIDDALIDKLEKEKAVLEGMDIDPETKEVQLGNKIKILKVIGFTVKPYRIYTSNHHLIQALHQIARVYTCLQM